MVSSGSKLVDHGRENRKPREGQTGTGRPAASQPDTHETQADRTQRRTLTDSENAGTNTSNLTRHAALPQPRKNTGQRPAGAGMRGGGGAAAAPPRGRPETS